MIDEKKPLFRWGPLSGYLINVDAWPSIVTDYPTRPHHYVWPGANMVFRDGQMLFVNESAPLIEVGSEIFRKIILTSRQKKFVKLWRTCVRELFTFCMVYSPARLRAMKGAELLQTWEKLNQLLFRFWEPGIIPEMGAYGAEAILKDALAREGLGSQKQMLALSYLSAPVRLSFYQEEEIALMKVAAHYGKKDFLNMLRKHQQRFFWIGNSYGAVREMPESFFLARVKKFLRIQHSPAEQIREVYRHLSLATKNHRQALGWVKRKDVLKKISDGLVHCIWWQDQRKGYIFHYLNYIDIFIREFARRNRVPSELYHMAWHNEINLHPTTRLIRVLKSRRHLYVVELRKNASHGLTIRASREFYRTFWAPPAPSNRKEFYGMVVYPSPKPVTGKVYIIRRHGDLARFPAGRIMVTSMTAPEYVTAIRKAKAIIADEGGLTCHAAIVSRELKVPCVVGTKVATQVLKNGDIIEIDSQTGVVKKL